MHLYKVNKVEFYGQIGEIHRTLRSPFATFVRNQVGLITALSTFLVPLFAWFVGFDKFWSVASGIPTFVIVGLGFHRFLASRLYLPASAREFFRTNDAEMRRIGRQVDQFNTSLYAQQGVQGLLPHPGRYNDETLAIYWEYRRKCLQEKANNFVLRFRDAVSVELRHMECVKDRVRMNPKRLRRAFKEKVLKLNELENCLGFAEGHYVPTVDLPPVFFALNLRKQLEQERLELGLPQSALPKLKTNPLFLTD